MKIVKSLQLFLAMSLVLIYSCVQAQTKNTSLIVDIPFGENEYISDLKAIDLNNDCADELIVLIESNNDHIYNYKWHDTYFQQIWANTIWPSNNVYGMQTADFDNDGKTDLLVSWEIGYPNLFLSFYKNYGDIFIDQGYLMLNCPNETFCAHDLNGDSLIDLATGSIFGNSGFSIQLYKHNSVNQTVQYIGLLPDGVNGSNLVKSLNIDNDNKMDILGVEKYSGALYTYLNEGDFSFIQTYTYQFPNGVYSIETIDFNNDGFEGFVAGEYNSGLQFFKNEGNGLFDLVFTSSSKESWNEIEATDIDHDGNTDIIAQSYSSHLYLFKNMGDYSFEEMVFPVSDTISYQMTVGDFDGNGEVDLVYGRNPAHVVFDVLNYFIPVSVQEQPGNKNRKSSVFQNVPNPFKGNTIIMFELHHGNKAELTIFDQTGKQIQSYPINKNMEALEIQGEELKPGIYFYQLKTDDGISETKKMIKF
jgi:hypothetical protein